MIDGLKGPNKKFPAWKLEKEKGCTPETQATPAENDDAIKHEDKLVIAGHPNTGKAKDLEQTR